jgi:hypothetical protein
VVIAWWICWLLAWVTALRVVHTDVVNADGTESQGTSVSAFYAMEDAMPTGLVTHAPGSRGRLTDRNPMRLARRGVRAPSPFSSPTTAVGPRPVHGPLGLRALLQEQDHRYPRRLQAP